jgi:hypothetical protein
MSARSDPIGAAVEQLVPAVVGASDWADVLQRSELRRPAGSVVSLARPRRTALAALAVLIAAVPALAASGTLQTLWRHRGPAIDLSAPLHDPSGKRAGSFKAEMPGVFATQDRPHHLLPHRMLHRGGLRPADTYRLRWEIELARGAALSGRIVYKPGVSHASKTITELCRPCGIHASGEVTLTRTEAALLLNGQLALSFETTGGTLRGTVPRNTQRGLTPRNHRPALTPNGRR